MSERTEKILAVLNAEAGPLEDREIAERTGIALFKVQQRLNSMVSRKKILKLTFNYERPGRYQRIKP